MTKVEPFELFALRFGVSGERREVENLIGGDLHAAGDRLDYYVWVARRSDRTFVIDTGFGEAAARQRGRTILHRPVDMLALLGIDALRVDDVILTHLHYDHAGTLGDFPRARLHVQDREIAYATGRCMCHAAIRNGFELDDVLGIVRRVYDGQVCFHDGPAELADGLSLHRIGGHTAGLQVVRVWTRRGWVVLASDASHFYANMERGLPFPIVDSVSDTLEGYRLLHSIADTPRHIIPGHDPAVMHRYGPPEQSLAGQVVRLDIAPNQ